MSPTVRYGLLLGILIVAWTFVMGFTGWYKNPALVAAFWIVIPIQIAVLWAALKATAAPGNSYGRQVLTGFLISLLGGVVAFFGSLVFTMVVFPEYFNEIEAMTAEVARAAGHTEEQVQLQVNAYRMTANSWVQAFMGFLGTTITGLLIALILGAFLKGKPAPAAQA